MQTSNKTNLSELDQSRQEYISKLLGDQEKEIEANWEKDNALIKKTLKMQDIPYETIEKDMKKEAPALIVKTAA